MTHFTRKPNRLTLPISEVFYSIEGEGPLTGYPTLFIRSFGCNFTCSGFSNPDSLPIEHDPDLTKFKPLRGCDSTYSWHPAYKHLTTKYDSDRLWSKAIDVVTSVRVAPEDPNDVLDNFPAVSITGGEPMLHQRFWTEFFATETALDNVRKLIIETNASVPPAKDFIDVMRDLEDEGCLVVWANSPKLSNSGEVHERAIRPSILLTQQQVTGSLQYVKFVSNGSPESFAEIKATVNEYNEFLYRHRTVGGRILQPEQIYVMPEGALKEQQEMVQRTVANGCLKHGYSFCARVHCWVYNNELGT